VCSRDACELVRNGSHACDEHHQLPWLGDLDRRASGSVLATWRM
jgi:hypothetical protein